MNVLEPARRTSLKKSNGLGDPCGARRFQPLASDYAVCGGFGGGGGGGGFGPPSAISIAPALGPETLLILWLTALITGSSIAATANEIITALISFFMKVKPP
jgi:hypothetical protein